MEYRMIRNAGLSLVLCAGLGLGALVLAPQLTFAEESDVEAVEESAVHDDVAATTEIGDADAETAEAEAGTDEAADGTAAAEREIKVAEGLSEEDAAAVEEGMTVKIIGQYFSNLREAVEVANQNGGGTITLLADTVATDDPEQTATIGFRTSIQISSEGDAPLTVYRADGQTGPLLAATDGTVRLKNVEFDGSGTGAAAPIIAVSDQCHFTVKEGVVIFGNSTDGSATDVLPASAISVSGEDAVLTLEEGCIIRGNSGTGDVEAAIYNDGATVENEGAIFEENTSEAGENPNYAGEGDLEGDEISAE